MSRGRSNTLIIGIIVGVVVCCIGPIVLIGGGAFLGFNKVKTYTTCALGFTQVRSAVLAYAAANKGKLPTASKWMDQVRPYYAKEVADTKDNPFGNMPVQGEWGCIDDDSRKTGMAFNVELSGKTLDSIKNPYETVVIFETEKPGLNLAEKYRVREPNSSPKMFNKPRGWFVATIKGELRAGNKSVNIGADGPGAKIEVKTGSDTK